MIRREERYTIHELLRQYGAEKLQETPDEANRAHERYCQYYAGFLHSRLAAINGPGQRQAAAEIAAELENIRAAWRRAVSQANVDLIRKAATTYYLFCQFRSYFLEGAKALEEAVIGLDRLPASPQRDLTLAQLDSDQGWLRIRLGQFDKAETVLERSRAIYERLDAPPPSYMGADPATPLAILAIIQGDHEQAVDLCQAARQASEARGDDHNLYFAHYGLTAAKLAQGEYETAYRHAERACALARAAGNRWFLPYPLNEWGNVAQAMGNYAEARRHYQASYAIKEEFDDPEGMAVALNHLGDIAILQNEFQEAQTLFRQSLEIYRTLNDRGGLAASLKGLGQAACARRDISTAREQFRQALQIAMETRFLPLVLSIIIEVETLLRSQDTLALRAALLTLALEHPASDHETRARARERLNRLETEMAATDYAAAVQRGRTWDLDTGAATLQAALAAPLASDQSDESQPDPDQPLIDPLTGRELEVLRLLAAGYTNPQIADELVLALGTVKWYASEIYGKLGVANRTEATVRAQELGLLE